MKENELIPHTFADSGRTVMVRKVSSLLILELQKAFPEPKPPTQEVEIAGVKRLEANPAHPDYQKALQAYQLDLEMKIRKLLIKRGVVCDVPKDEVDDLRTFWREEFNQELDPSDLLVYVSYLACTTDGDLQDLVEKITRRSQPTEAEIQANIKSFRSEV